MTKTVNSNYGSVGAPGSTFDSRISADSDAFDRNDVDALGNALDNHDHTAGKGLAVGRLAATTVISGGGTLTWPTSTDTIVGKATTDTLTNKTLTSPSMTGPTITSGNLGIGAAPGSDKGINLSGNLFAAATSDYGVFSDVTFPSTATVEGSALFARVNTAVAAFTVTSAYGLHVLAPIKGAGSAITSAYGVQVEAQTAGATNNYGGYFTTPSGGSGLNLGLYAGGDVVLGIASLATNATTGFVFLPVSAGQPTGVPGANGVGVAAGHAPMEWDSSNNKLWVYSGGWKGVVLA